MKSKIHVFNTLRVRRTFECIEAAVCRCSLIGAL